MGGPMAQNLIKAGHDLTVFDLSPEAVKKATDAGASAASSSSDVARGVDAMVTMLPAGAHVSSVYLGEDGLLAAADAS